MKLQDSLAVAIIVFIVILLCWAFNRCSKNYKRVKRLKCSIDDPLIASHFAEWKKNYGRGWRCSRWTLLSPIGMIAGFVFPILFFAGAGGLLYSFWKARKLADSMGFTGKDALLGEVKFKKLD